MANESDKLKLKELNGDELGKLLDYSARYGSKHSVKKLIDFGVDVNFEDDFGNTALISSIGGVQEDGEITCYLIEKGARVNVGAPVNAVKLAQHEKDSASLTCMKDAIDWPIQE